MQQAAERVLEERVQRTEGRPDPEYYLRERYAGGERSALLRPYYALKPLLPRRIQIALRRQHAKRRAQTAFPRWPAEDVLVRHQQDSFRERIRMNSDEPVPFVNCWTGGRRFAFVL